MKRRTTWCRWFGDLRDLIASFFGCDPGITIVFHLGVVQESDVTPAKTPQFRRFLFPGVVEVMADITATQRVNVSVTFKNRRGGAARVEGVPEWATDNSDVVALTPAADGMSCMVTAVGMVGTANVQVTADADLGSGVKPVIGTLAVNVTPGEAATVDLVPGTPEETPDVPPPV